MVSFSKLPGIVAFCIVVLTNTLGSAAPVPDSGQGGVAKSTPVNGGAAAAGSDGTVYVRWS